LEIYTDKEGGVIFRKYSLLGGLSDFAVQFCETLNKSTGHIAVICDRDTCLAVAGTARREIADKRISADLESIMSGRQFYHASSDSDPLPVCDDSDKYFISAAAPILSEGDVLGCVLFAALRGDAPVGDVECKLAQTVAAFLGRQMES
jgi:AbrB family transcriptional regulator (stage V sporulation protein T)